jgi:hypothetical protein
VKASKILEGTNQGKFEMQYKTGERIDVKGLRQWKASTALSARHKMSITQTNRCATNHDTVLRECIHVISSRLNYPHRREGTPAFIYAQIKEHGALYKEISHPSNEGKKRRQEEFSVGAVMIYHRSLEWDRSDAIMITNISTSIHYESGGLAASFFADICTLHSDGTHVFAMVMNKEDIPDAMVGRRSTSGLKVRSTEAFYYHYGFRTDKAHDNFLIDDEFIEAGCFLMKHTI